MNSTETKNPTEDTPLELDATLVSTETYEPFWGGLLKPVESMVAMLPTHRDSKKGRQTAKQVRVALLAVGLAILAFGGWPILLIGAALAASALVIPVSQSKRRSWVTSLRRKRKHRKRRKTEPARIVYDGKRVSLWRGDKKLRRVLVDRGEHTLEMRRRDDSPCLGVRPPSKRKADSIWICAPDHGSAASEERPLTESDVDIVVEVAPNDWELINRSLNE